MEIPRKLGEMPLVSTEQVKETTMDTEEEQTLTEEPLKEFRFEMRINPEWAGHIRKVANLAATLGVISEDRRGNLTAWANYCLNLGEEWLKEQVKAKGI